MSEVQDDAVHGELGFLASQDAFARTFVPTAKYDSGAASSSGGSKPPPPPPAQKTESSAAASHISNRGALTQELLGDMQARMRRPTEAEVSAMAGRIASTRKMSHAQEMQVRQMLRDIANALFGDEEPPATQPAASGKPPPGPGMAAVANVGGAVRPSSSGSQKPRAPSVAGSSSQLNTARSSVHSRFSSGVGDGQESSSGVGDATEVLHQEVDFLLGELCGNIYEPSESQSHRSVQSRSSSH